MMIRYPESVTWVDDTLEVYMPGPLDARGIWIHSDQVARFPAGFLNLSEVGRFLEFLFGDVAKKPAKLTLNESAGVARYLNWLASHGVPKAVIKKGRKAQREYLIKEERRKTGRLEATPSS